MHGASVNEAIIVSRKSRKSPGNMAQVDQVDKAKSEKQSRHPCNSESSDGGGGCGCGCSLHHLWPGASSTTSIGPYVKITRPGPEPPPQGVTVIWAALCNPVLHSKTEASAHQVHCKYWKGPSEVYGG